MAAIDLNFIESFGYKRPNIVMNCEMINETQGFGIPSFEEPYQKVDFSILNNTQRKELFKIFNEHGRIQGDGYYAYIDQIWQDRYSLKVTFVPYMDHNF